MAKVIKQADKERALNALLNAPTLTSAAEMAGIDRRTLYNYLHNDSQFALEYKRQRQLKNIERAEQAANERETALNTIRDIMNDNSQPALIRLKAAEKLLEISDKGNAKQDSIASDIFNEHSGFCF